MRMPCRVISAHVVEWMYCTEYKEVATLQTAKLLHVT